VGLRRTHGTVRVRPHLALDGGAWCWAVDDGEYERLELHVQLFGKHRGARPDTKEFTRLRREFEDRLGPRGYAILDQSITKERPFAVFDKRISTLARARRERGILDQILFGG
jgi:hypothetical protein